MSSIISRAKIALSTLFVLSAAALAVPSTSATATYSDVANSDGTFTYQLLLKNTGSTNINTFWYSWIPYLSFLPSVPTSIVSPANWSGQVDQDYYGNSILWDTTGTGLAPGASLAGFSFTSTDSPAVLAGVDNYFGFYPVDYAYVYSGAVTTPSDPLPPNFALVTAVPGTVPEPASISLLLSALPLLSRRRHRA